MTAQETLSLLRRGLLVLLVIGAAGLIPELVLLEHYEDGLQFIPFGLLALTVVVTVWHWVDGRLMNWTNWFTRQKQPNNKGGVEHFGVMSNQERPVNGLINWEWSDQPNESTQHQPGYVCEWDAVSAPAP